MHEWARSRISPLVRLGAAISAALMLTAIAASAAPAAINVSSTADPGIATNGQVDAVARSDSTIYLGGSFSLVAQRTGPLAVTDAGTGGLSAPVPQVSGGSVYALVSDGAGGFFIGGSFTAVDGISRDYLAHILPDGELDTAWTPDATSAVGALALLNNTLYVGGQVNGGSNNVYAVGAGSGQVLNSWSPAVNGPVNGILATPASIYVGGSFTSPHNNLAAFDPTTGALQSWNPNPNGSAVPAAFDPATGDVYIRGSFDHVGATAWESVAKVSGGSGALDSAWSPGITSNNAVTGVVQAGSTVYLAGGTSHSIEGFNSTTGAPTGWHADLSGSVAQMALSGTALYVVGSFGTAGGATRNNAAAFDLTTGEVTSWNPSVLSGAGTVAVSSDGSHVAIGGGFAGVGAVPRQNAAAEDALTGQLSAWNPAPNGQVNALAPNGNQVWVAGDFEGFGSIGGDITASRGGLAAVDATTGALLPIYPGDWFYTPINQIVMADGALYVIGDFDAVVGPNGVFRDELAAINPADGTVTSFDPTALASGALYALAVSGSTVYVGGGFKEGSSSTTDYAAAFNGTTGALLPWDPTPDSFVTAITATPSAVYLGGAFANVDGTPRSSAAAVNPTSGALLAWNPQVAVNGDPGFVYGIAVSGETAYLEGDFNTVQGQSVGALAAVDATSGTLLAWNPGPSVGEVQQPLAGDGAGGVIVAGNFGSFGVAPALTAAPALTGSGITGSPLTCGQGQWSGTQPQAYSQRWLRDGVPVQGATGSSYTPGSEDVGDQVTCRVTARNLSGSAHADSAPVTVAQAAAGPGGSAGSGSTGGTQTSTTGTGTGGVQTGPAGSGVAATPAAGKSTTTTHTITFDNQKITLVMPAAGVCLARKASLTVRFSTAGIKGSKRAKLTFKRAAFYLERGVKHTAKKASTTERLKLAGLKSGKHTLELVVTYTEHGVKPAMRAKRKHGGRTSKMVTKSLSDQFKICST